MFGRNDAVRQLAVGRDHQQALGILIQPPAGIAPIAAYIGGSRSITVFCFLSRAAVSTPGGLVEHHVADGLVIQRPAVQPDIVHLAADLHARVLRRPAVHRHAPRAHHRFDFASRALAEQRQAACQAAFCRSNPRPPSPVVSCAFHYTARQTVLQSRGAPGDFFVNPHDLFFLCFLRPSGTKNARLDAMCSKTVRIPGVVMETSHEFAFPFAQIMV